MYLVRFLCSHCLFSWIVVVPAFSTSRRDLLFCKNISIWLQIEWPGRGSESLSLSLSLHRFGLSDKASVEDLDSPHAFVSVSFLTVFGFLNLGSSHSPYLAGICFLGEILDESANEWPERGLEILLHRFGNLSKKVWVKGNTVGRRILNWLM